MGSKRAILFLVIVVVVLVILNGVALTTIWMQQRTPRSQAGKAGIGTGSVHQLLKQELGWNEDQLQQFDQERQTLRERTRPLLKEIHQLKQAMFDASLAVEPDREHVAALAARIGEKQARMEQATADHVMRLHAICTPEQREKLAGFLQELLQMGRPEDMARPAHPPRERRRQPPPPRRR